MMNRRCLQVVSYHCRYVRFSATKEFKRENWLLQFDGGSRGNPGIAGAGAVLYTLDGDGSENSIIKKTEKWAGYFYIGNSTNNVAEYMGLIEGLKQAIVLDIKYIEIEGDSQLVICQLNGIYKVKHSNLIPLYKGYYYLTTNYLFHNYNKNHYRSQINDEAFYKL